MNTASTETNGISLSDARQRLENDGFMVVAGLCNFDFVAHLLDVSVSRSGKVMAALGTQDIGIGSAAGFDEVVVGAVGGERALVEEQDPWCLAEEIHPVCDEDRGERKQKQIELPN